MALLFLIAVISARAKLEEPPDSYNVSTLSQIYSIVIIVNIGVVIIFFVVVVFDIVLYGGGVFQLDPEDHLGEFQ